MFSSDKPLPSLFITSCSRNSIPRWVAARARRPKVTSFASIIKVQSNTDLLEPDKKVDVDQEQLRTLLTFITEATGHPNLPNYVVDVMWPHLKALKVCLLVLSLFLMRFMTILLRIGKPCLL